MQPRRLVPRWRLPDSANYYNDGDSHVEPETDVDRVARVPGGVRA